MKDAQAQATTDELEIVEMFGVDAGRRVNLQRIVIVRRVLEKAVEGIEHFVRKQEEKLSGQQNDHER
jgi:hypothetical protein